MVPGLALWLPSGYSWGAALLLLCALASAGVWLKRPLSAPSWWLLSAMLGMGSIWLLDIGTALLGRDFDKPSKYFLALPCVAYALAFPPRLAWLWAGVWLGACGSGLLALYQTSVQALPRATGFTNAIQYGDLSLVLGMMCAVLLLVEWPRWRHWQKLGWALAMLLGCLGSLLSGSRGGWLALLVVLPVCAPARWCWPCWPRCCCSKAPRSSSALAKRTARRRSTNTKAMPTPPSATAWRTGGWRGKWG